MAPVMVCFGGNGRSSGFPGMVSHKVEESFLKLDSLLSEYGLEGVDYNWEYPGYDFGRGYKTDCKAKSTMDSSTF